MGRPRFDRKQLESHPETRAQGQIPLSHTSHKRPLYRNLPKVLRRFRDGSLESPAETVKYFEGRSACFWILAMPAKARFR
jgi:hypothetical protein